MSSLFFYGMTLQYICCMQYAALIPATHADIPDLEKLVNGAYRGESSRLGWTTEADLLDGIRTDPEGLAHMIDRPGSFIFITRDAGGMLQACVHLEKQGSKLYLGMLTVKPDLQGAGMGKAILQQAEYLAKRWELAEIEMTVITDRRELIAWYQKNGYNLTGEIKPFPNDPRFGIPRKHLQFEVLRKTII